MVALPAASTITPPLYGAVHVHQTEFVAGKPLWAGSPGSEVAVTSWLLPEALAPTSGARLANRSLAGGGRYSTQRPNHVPSAKLLSTAIEYVVALVALNTSFAIWIESSLVKIIGRGRSGADRCQRRNRRNSINAKQQLVAEIGNLRHRSIEA